MLSWLSVNQKPKGWWPRRKHFILSLRQHCGKSKCWMNYIMWFSATVAETAIQCGWMFALKYDSSKSRTRRYIPPQLSVGSSVVQHETEPRMPLLLASTNRSVVWELESHSVSNYPVLPYWPLPFSKKSRWRVSVVADNLKSSKHIFVCGCSCQTAIVIWW